MWMECFAGDARIEAEDAETIVERFLLHAADSHDWSYPEQSPRNYARNYAEANERLTGSTVRLVEIDEVTIHPVTEDRIDDWLDFFDHDAFAGNPDWASCYCLEPHVSDTAEVEQPWRDIRGMMIDQLRTGAHSGISHTSVRGLPVGSTRHPVPITSCSASSTWMGPTRHRWSECHASSWLRPTGGMGSPRCFSTV